MCVSCTHIHSQARHLACIYFLPIGCLHSSIRACLPSSCILCRRVLNFFPQHVLPLQVDFLFTDFVAPNWTFVILTHTHTAAHTPAQQHPLHKRTSEREITLWLSFLLWQAGRLVSAETAVSCALQFSMFSMCFPSPPSFTSFIFCPQFVSLRRSRRLPENTPNFPYYLAASHSF